MFLSDFSVKRPVATVVIIIMLRPLGTADKDAFGPKIAEMLATVESIQVISGAGTCR